MAGRPGVRRAALAAPVDGPFPGLTRGLPGRRRPRAGRGAASRGEAAHPRRVARARGTAGVGRAPGSGLMARAAGSESGTGVIELGADSVPEMLDLVALTEPGPFWPRTHELGTYLGVRVDGTLVAMAGERLCPPGWTEISAVCTAPDARGQGHAARLVSALAARIVARGERPFLHVAETNTGAIALYERLGFKTRRQVTFRGFRTP
ncbi:GNAT family N-acetyltransferase [Streptomyces sp. NPDC052016]|uniref:GNAT family N-acetyltransferase n=1 Tax=Streptomyces sp. NPDC052016 TaxID=3365680 RepID=UPI0037D4D554